MPKRVLILGLLFCFAGLWYVWSTIEAAMNKRIFLNFGVLLIPVGIGLLRGRASSQRWARFWIILLEIVLLVVVCISVAEPKYLEVSWFGTKIRGSQAIPYALGYATFFWAALYTGHRLLYSPKASAYLSKR